MASDHDQIIQLMEEVSRLKASQRSHEQAIYALSEDVSTAFIVTCGALTLFIQTGFAMLETGVVANSNVLSVMVKNLLDSSIAGICFWLWAYGIAYGHDMEGFVGSDGYAFANGINGNQTFGKWFYRWTTFTVSVTIVSGAVCERIRVKSYLVFTVWMCTVVTPFVVHWVWGGGFLSPYARLDDNNVSHPLFGSHGLLDFSGAGVVHMVGGIAALTGAVILGPRAGRFDPITGQARFMEGHNMTMVVLGCGIIIFGSVGFNCGSIMTLHNNSRVLGRIAVNTVIAGGGGCVTGLIVSHYMTGFVDLQITVNSIIASLVGVTASCDWLPHWGALIVGCVAVLAYCGGRVLLLRLNIDDPVEAVPVHLFAGMWGVLAAGIFCRDDTVHPTYRGKNGPTIALSNSCVTGEQIGVQILGIVCIVAWCGITSSMCWGLMSYWNFLRVPKNWEEVGMDLLEHGQNAYNPRTQDVGLIMETGGKHHGAKLDNMDWSEHMPAVKMDSSNSTKRGSEHKVSLDVHRTPLPQAAGLCQHVMLPQPGVQLVQMAPSTEGAPQLLESASSYHHVMAQPARSQPAAAPQPDHASQWSQGSSHTYTYQAYSEQSA